MCINNFYAKGYMFKMLQFQPATKQKIKIASLFLKSKNPILQISNRK